MGGEKMINKKILDGTELIEFTASYDGETVGMKITPKFFNTICPNGKLVDSYKIRIINNLLKTLGEKLDMTNNQVLADKLDDVGMDITAYGFDHYPEITYDDLNNLTQFAHKLRTLKLRKL